MCIRDRFYFSYFCFAGLKEHRCSQYEYSRIDKKSNVECNSAVNKTVFQCLLNPCLLYTSDAADERSSVDLGGRRIIKKKKHVDVDGVAQSHKNREYMTNNAINTSNKLSK